MIITVKPLVWEELEQDRGDGTGDLTGDHEAVSVAGLYSIDLSWGSDAYYWSVAINGDEIGRGFEGLEQAKAAAQADYAARILSALDLSAITRQATPDQSAALAAVVSDAEARGREAGMREAAGLAFLEWASGDMGNPGHHILAAIPLKGEIE